MRGPSSGSCRKPCGERPAVRARSDVSSRRGGGTDTAGESGRKGVETLCSLTSGWVRGDGLTTPVAQAAVPVKPAAPRSATGLTQGLHLRGAGDTGLLRLQGDSGRCSRRLPVPVRPVGHSQSPGATDLRPFVGGQCSLTRMGCQARHPRFSRPNRMSVQNST